jgi:hypothetical protein
MDRSRRRSQLLFCGGVVLCLLALVGLVISVVAYARTASEPGIRLDEGPQRLVLPADRTYGVYVDDADNSGYSERCSAVNSLGQQIPLSDPWWTFSGSETEMLDIVFNTGSGNLTIDCSVPGERITLRPVPNLRATLIGVGLSGILGVAGAVLMLLWFTTRRPRQPHAPPVSGQALGPWTT